MVGRTLGRYRLLEEIGQGGMAVVYRGVDTTLQREVAVKILHPHLSRKARNRDRFAREARVVANLHHDNIVEIYDFSGGAHAGPDGEAGAAGEDAFIVTEYIRGRTLAEFLESSPAIPVEIGCLLVSELAQALAHAHDQGIVHRDIKPENVMIRQDGVLKLMDFGIARAIDEASATMTGTLVGSPAYMSPEQIASGELDARSDLFSLGVLLYRLVTGRLPFDGNNPAALLNAISHGQPVPPDQINPLVGHLLSATILRALAKDPRTRHAGVRAFADDLRIAIADAGMGTAREEIAAYFSDPEGYVAILGPRLVARYADAGRRRADARDMAGAMELWSRVLELDPEHAEVRQALERLGRGRDRRRRIAILAGAPLLLAGMTIAGARAWPLLQPADGPAPMPTSALATASATPAPGASGSASPVSSPSVSAAASPAASPSRSPAEVAASPAPTPAGRPSARGTPDELARMSPRDRWLAMVPASTPAPLPAGKGAFTLNIVEYATISIGTGNGDDRDYGDSFDAKVMQDGIHLDPGTYRVTLTPNEESLGAGCEPLKGSVRISAGERTGEIVVDGVRREDPYLRGCPTAVKIIVDPPVDAEVRIDGTVVARAGAEFRTPSGTHEVTVAAPGYRPWTRRMEIRRLRRRDALVEIRATLDPAPQADASPVP